MERLLKYATRRDTNSESLEVGAESPVVKGKQKRLAVTLGAIVGVVVLALLFVCVVTYFRRRRRSRESRFGFRANRAPFDDEITFIPRSHNGNSSTLMNTPDKRRGCVVSRDTWSFIQAKVSKDSNNSSLGSGLPQLTPWNPISASECTSQSSRSPVSQQPWPGTIQQDRQNSRRHTTPILNSHRSNLDDASTTPTTVSTSDSFAKVGAINPLQAHPKSPVESRPPTPSLKPPMYAPRFNKRLPSIASVTTQTSQPDSKLNLTLNLNKPLTHRIENPIPSPSIDFPPRFGFESMLFPPHLPNRMSSKKSCQSRSMTKSSSVITLPDWSASNSTSNGAPPLKVSASILSKWRKTREAANISPPRPVEKMRPESCTLGEFGGCGDDCDCNGDYEGESMMSIRDAERVDLTGSVYLCHRRSSIYG